MEQRKEVALGHHLLRRATAILVAFLLGMPAGWSRPALALDGEAIARLHRAGVSDLTIAAIVRTKAIETGLTSVDQIERMRAAGIADKTIRLLIAQGALAPDSPRIYGQTTRTVETTGIDDLIALKEAGFSDAVIQALIVYRSDQTAAAERQRAWQMLTGMGLIIERP
jgi:hypothetical protein